MARKPVDQNPVDNRLEDTSWRADVDPSALAVREGEEPWTREELDEVIDDLIADLAKQRSAIELAEAELVNLREGSEGAGRDSADIGSNQFERDQERLLAHSARATLEQDLEALRAIRSGSYGTCDNCGEPIGKGRLSVFPRASLCVTCKQRQERR